MNLTFTPIHIFRETSNVTFFDTYIKDSNGTDIVIHRNGAISPPGIAINEKYYVHNHQVDNNLVIEGNRTFTLLNPSWDEPHHIVYLKREMGALNIPAGTFHRSISGQKGSIVLNQAIRDNKFNAKEEFNPVKINNNLKLIKAKKEIPIIWYSDKGNINRIKEDKFSRYSMIKNNFNY